VARHSSQTVPACHFFSFCRASLPYSQSERVITSAAKAVRASRAPQRSRGAEHRARQGRGIVLICSGSRRLPPAGNGASWLLCNISSVGFGDSEDPRSGDRGSSSAAKMGFCVFSCVREAPPRRCGGSGFLHGHEIRFAVV
jgi:hypothetical protein